MLALLGTIRVVVGKDKVEISGDDPREAARVAEVLRQAHYRVDCVGVNELEFGVVRVDVARLTLSRPDGTTVVLSSRELKILREFAARPGAVLSRDHLLKTCWGFGYWGTTRTVDQMIANLRKKLGETVHIVSVRGEGYRLEIGKGNA